MRADSYTVKTDAPDRPQMFHSASYTTCDAAPELQSEVENGTLLPVCEAKDPLCSVPLHAERKKRIRKCIKEMDGV